MSRQQRHHATNIRQRWGESYSVQGLPQVGAETLALSTGLFHHVLRECNPVRGCLALVVVRGVTWYVPVLELRGKVAILPKPLEEVKLLGEDAVQHSELVKADEIGPHQVDRLVSLPAVISPLFLQRMSGESF